MGKRPTIHRYAIIAFILIILIVGWEYDRAHVALASSVIPQESIRLRILAHSDDPQEQWLKIEVRDAIIDYMNRWVGDAEDIYAARLAVRSRLGDFEQVVEQVLRQHGFTHSFQIEFGSTEFPTKIYGKKVYPAGDYEALKVTIGAGEGQNWWCVLFPPLCFVELASGEKWFGEEQENETGDQTVVHDGETEEHADHDLAKHDRVEIAGSEQSESENEVDVRFFFIDLFQFAKNKINGWFA